MLQFGLRLGDWPRQLVTTTPRPLPLLKELIADPASVVTRAATRANAANLAPSFLESVVAQYAGTRLGRQELDGEIDRRARGRAVDARHAGARPRRRGAAAEAHRRRGRSAGELRQARRQMRHRRRGD